MTTIVVLLAVVAIHFTVAAILIMLDNATPSRTSRINYAHTEASLRHLANHSNGSIERHPTDR